MHKHKRPRKTLTQKHTETHSGVSGSVSKDVSLELGRSRFKHQSPLDQTLGPNLKCKINWKNNCLLQLQQNIWKSHTHVKKVGTPQNFFLAFIDEFEKQINIKKIVEVGQ